ncbi:MULTISPECIES: MmcQ/YjbR family DNA-binding protein [Sorangium]|uniref:MmcQ/YjbR family DNA-binding protein n=1 Tax=Sorangium atrum TaxID=2995308 RepID=A0ABT5C077_9BACT|nr:MmcQ/YjbR family DNA-binding protein [Sorangium aterium]MDC0679820.1 MmcQ/YjbR family DNA-binding protein [Sorangium aterium]
MSSGSPTPSTPPPPTHVPSAFRSEDFQRLALSLPEAEEQDHWGKPSFRVRGKIFATHWVAEEHAVLKLSLEEQDSLVQAQPDVFSVTPWGHQGWTRVELRRVDRALLEELLVGAWRRVAPKRVVAQWDAGRNGKPTAPPDAPSRPARRRRAP